MRDPVEVAFLSDMADASVAFLEHLGKEGWPMVDPAIQWPIGHGTSNDCPIFPTPLPQILPMQRVGLIHINDR
ncbi:hypothetical protein [Fodinicurvata sp. EGI_FJ10296]|uniref:hypothetical protein n=1 Tax=Fodinicurvata sp. EGI_FJ10296 TaxID=3231908 RepID=UPI003456401B